MSLITPGTLRAWPVRAPVTDSPYNRSHAVLEQDADALRYEIDLTETARLRAALAAADNRPRGLKAYEVHPLGERLIQRP